MCLGFTGGGKKLGASAAYARHCQAATDVNKPRCSHILRLRSIVMAWWLRWGQAARCRGPHARWKAASWMSRANNPEASTFTKSFRGVSALRLRSLLASPALGARATKPPNATVLVHAQVCTTRSTSYSPSLSSKIERMSYGPHRPTRAQHPRSRCPVGHHPWATSLAWPSRAWARESTTEKSRSGPREAALRRGHTRRTAAPGLRPSFSPALSLGWNTELQELAVPVEMPRLWCKNASRAVFVARTRMRLPGKLRRSHGWNGQQQTRCQSRCKAENAPCGGRMVLRGGTWRPRTSHVAAATVPLPPAAMRRPPHAPPGARPLHSAPLAVAASPMPPPAPPWQPLRAANTAPLAAAAMPSPLHQNTVPLAAAVPPWPPRRGAQTALLAPAVLPALRPAHTAPPLAATLPQQCHESRAPAPRSVPPAPVLLRRRRCLARRPPHHSSTAPRVVLPPTAGLPRRRCCMRRTAPRGAPTHAPVCRLGLHRRVVHCRRQWRPAQPHVVPLA